MQLNGSRKVIGVLRGYDVFLNIVLDEAVEEKDGGEKVRIGTVVRLLFFCWESGRVEIRGVGWCFGMLIVFGGVSGVLGYTRKLSCDVGGIGENQLTLVLVGVLL